MKVLGVCGSPRKSLTESSLAYALDIFSAYDDCEPTMYTLRQKKINFCIHCNRCIKDNLRYCPVYDDGMTKLYPLMEEADIILLASPVYNMAPSGQTMTMLNRLRPLGKMMSEGGWAKKVGISLAVGGTRHGGQETALGVLNNAILSFGMNCVSAGVLAYNGASLWNQGESSDETGKECISHLARRAYWSAKQLRGEVDGVPGYLLAGFSSQEQRDDRMNRFRR